jgi:radical SAM protein with 4Fe4S-binding SPASM domain
MMISRYVLKELKIEVTRACPLSCLHCSSNGEPAASEMLEPSRLMRLLVEFADIGGERVVISGGEPLGYEELPAILRACRALGLRTQLYTTGIASRNGSLKTISERLVEFAAENGVGVIYSLHGACSRTHDLLTRVSGSFNATMSAMEKTFRAGLPIEVHVVPTALNYSEITVMIKTLAEIPVRKVSLLRFVPQGRGMIHRSSLELGKEQLWELRQTKDVLQRQCHKTTVRAGAPFNILCPESLTSCVAGLSELVVRPDGRAIPCDAFKQFRTTDRFGNILAHSLSEVWARSELLTAVRLLQESKASSSCASCELYAHCGSGCFGQKAIAAQDIVDGKDPECLADLARARHGSFKPAAVC